MKYFPQVTPCGSVIFCDDSREENNGKRLYVGVYNSKLMIQGSAPVLLPKLSFSVSYFERPGESTDPVELIIFLPGDARDTPTIRIPMPMEEIRQSPLPEDPDAEDPQIGINLNLEISPFQVTQAGRIKVRAWRGDLDVRLGSLTVEFAAPEVVVSSEG